MTSSYAPVGEYQPLPWSNRIGILTIGGGLGVVAAEACEREGRNLNMVRQRVEKYGRPVFMVKPALEFATDLEASSLFRREGIPVYPNPHRAARVLHHLAWYRDYLDAAER